MKRKPYCRALLAGLAACGSAQAVTLSPHGLGQVLVYPYYTVMKGQDTLISVGNASNVGKVAKVMLLEGRNGRPALTFNLFLSAHDVWTGRISGSDGAAPRIHSADTGCTFPRLPAAGVPLRDHGYASEDPAAIYPADGGPAGIERTREGMLVVLAMGDIVPGTELEQTISHQGSGQPGGSAPACEPAIIGANSFQSIATPGDHLYGSGSIVNVGEGTFFSYNADALSDFTDTPIDRANPQVRHPSFDLANSAESTQGGAIANLVDGNGHTFALDYAAGASAVSAVYMAEAISNEYLVAADIGANTDWIVTLPTRSHHVDRMYVDAAVPPFVELANAGLSNVVVAGRVYGQDADTVTDTTMKLPYQVNALSLRDNSMSTLPSAVLGSRMATTVEPFGAAGWMQLGFTEEGHVLGGASGGAVLKGLPSTGFMVYNIVNSGASAGTLANYSGTFAHRAHVGCVAGTEAAGAGSCGPDTD